MNPIYWSWMCDTTHNYCIQRHTKHRRLIHWHSTHLKIISTSQHSYYCESRPLSFVYCALCRLTVYYVVCTHTTHTLTHKHTLTFLSPGNYNIFRCIYTIARISTYIKCWFYVAVCVIVYTLRENSPCVSFCRHIFVSISFFVCVCEKNIIKILPHTALPMLRILHSVHFSSPNITYLYFYVD